MTDTVIRDGTGTGSRARVGSDNRIFSDAVTASRLHISNHVYQDAYTAVFEVTPGSPGNLFFYLENSNQSKDLIVWTLGVRPAAEEGIEIRLGATGTPVDGTPVAPANRTAGTGRTGQATVEYGTNITGISNGKLANRIYFPSGQGSVDWECPCGLVVPANETLTMYAVNGSIKLNIDMLFEFHKPENTL